MPNGSTPRQREGFLLRDCQRLVNQDRNVFAACMVAMGDADAMVTGVDPQLRGHAGRRADGDRPRADTVLFGLTLLLARRSGTGAGRRHRDP
jgi:malate dehydrogenase (oxaloacetate-decarboxylating)(NADP+)